MNRELGGQSYVPKLCATFQQVLGKSGLLLSQSLIYLSLLWLGLCHIDNSRATDCLKNLSSLTSTLLTSFLVVTHLIHGESWPVTLVVSLINPSYEASWIAAWFYLLCATASCYLNAQAQNRLAAYVNENLHGNTPGDWGCQEWIKFPSSLVRSCSWANHRGGR